VSKIVMVTQTTLCSTYEGRLQSSWTGGSAPL